MDTDYIREWFLKLEEEALIELKNQENTYTKKVLTEKIPLVIKILDFTFPLDVQSLSVWYEEYIGIKLTVRNCKNHAELSKEYITSENKFSDFYIVLESNQHIEERNYGLPILKKHCVKLIKKKYV